MRSRSIPLALVAPRVSADLALPDSQGADGQVTMVVRDASTGLPVRGSESSSLDAGRGRSVHEQAWPTEPSSCRTCPRGRSRCKWPRRARSSTRWWRSGSIRADASVVDYLGVAVQLEVSLVPVGTTECPRARSRAAETGAPLGGAAVGVRPRQRDAPGDDDLGDPTGGTPFRSSPRVTTSGHDGGGPRVHVVAGHA